MSNTIIPFSIYIFMFFCSSHCNVQVTGYMGFSAKMDSSDNSTSNQASGTVAKKKLVLGKILGPTWKQ